MLFNSLSAGPLKPGHQCSCMKSLIVRPNSPWKNIKKTAHFEAGLKRVPRKKENLGGREEYWSR